MQGSGEEKLPSKTSKTKKLKVAVTGGIGSGKSLFCKILNKMGYPVLYADDISKEILANDKQVREQVISAFGKESYPGGLPNKKYLAEKVFSDPENLITLNSILHPIVISKQKELIKKEFRSSDIVFLEAALIYEADIEEEFDYVVLITADDHIKLERKVKLGMTEEEFMKRLDNQIPDKEKMNRADFVFINNGSEKELESKANLLITILKSLLN